MFLVCHTFHRKHRNQKQILGISAGTVEEAQAAEKAGADYIGVGAVFGTSTKKNARNTHAMADVK